jgi:ABC-type Fe3+ transport system permease subunit
VLAGLGYWWTLSRLSQPRRQIFRATAIAIVTAECVMGLLLGLQGYYSNFESFNPGLYGAIRSHFGAP